MAISTPAEFVATGLALQMHDTSREEVAMWLYRMADDMATGQQLYKVTAGMVRDMLRRGLIAEGRK